MRADARSKTSSYTSDEAEEGKFYVKPNSSPPSDSDEQADSPPHERNHVAAEANGKAKRRSQVKPQPCSSKKRSSEIDLEELLAQTYPKETLASAGQAKLGAAEEEVRRSSRKRQKPEKKPEKAADSAKKWTGEEEICMAKALMESSSGGVINMTAFYQRARDIMPCETSNSQLYDKMRNMSKRFRSIQSKLREQNVPEDRFTYRTPQEPTLFKMWKQIWGNNGNVSEAENPGENGVDNPRGNGAENPGENEAENPRGAEADEGHATAGDSAEDHRREHEEEEEKRHQTLGENAKEIGECEGKDLECSMQRMLENTESRLAALMEASLHRVAAVSIQHTGGFAGMGAYASSILSRRMKDLMDAVDAADEFPGMDASDARDLQQRWRKHRIQEVKMFSECLDLLQRQCKSFLEHQESSKSGHES